MSFANETFKLAHSASIFNESMVEASTICACFDCLEAFPSDWIADWIDEQIGKPKTARCPHCGNDAVLGDASGYPITDPIFLTAMNRRWFNEEDDDAQD